MPNSFFRFKQFTVHHDRCAMKVTTDGCLFGAWVAQELAGKKEAVKNCLDIGAGTGLLSLMIAQKSDAIVEAIEIDKEAAEQATENVQASKWKNRIHIIQDDVLHWSTNAQYDCIVSNPPFYESQLRSDERTKNLAHHETGLTLSSLFSFIKNHLTPDGSFFLLIPAVRLDETVALLKRNGLFVHQRISVKQTPKHQPFRVMIEATKKEKPEAVESAMEIKNDKGQYTQNFVNLLRDYYLYLQSLF